MGNRDAVMEIFPQLTFIETAGCLRRLGSELRLGGLVMQLLGFALTLCVKNLTPLHFGYFFITYFHQLDNRIA